MPDLRADPARDTSDEQLLTEAGHGDLRSFERLIRRHERPLLNYVLRLGATPEVAEDVWARTWTVLAGELDQLPLADRPEIWLLRTARRLLARRAAEDLQQTGDGPSVAPPSLAPIEPGASPEDTAAMRRRFEPWVRDALAAIPRQRREALILKIYHGLSYKDIGRIVGAPPGTVYYWIHISLSEIAKHI